MGLLLTQLPGNAGASAPAPLVDSVEDPILEEPTKAPAQLPKASSSPRIPEVSNEAPPQARKEQKTSVPAKTAAQRAAAWLPSINPFTIEKVCTVLLPAAKLELS